MWLKLGRSKPKVLADELREIAEKQTEEKAEKKKEKLAKREAKIMFSFLKHNFKLSAKKGKNYWTCDDKYFIEIMKENNLHSDESYLYEELKKICERNKIGTDIDITYLPGHKLKDYAFYWD